MFPDDEADLRHLLEEFLHRGARILAQKRAERQLIAIRRHEDRCVLTGQHERSEGVGGFLRAGDAAHATRQKHAIPAILRMANGKRVDRRAMIAVGDDLISQRPAQREAKRIWDDGRGHFGRHLLRRLSRFDVFVIRDRGGNLVCQYSSCERLPPLSTDGLRNAYFRRLRKRSQRPCQRAGSGSRSRNAKIKSTQCTKSRSVTISLGECV